MTNSHTLGPSLAIQVPDKSLAEVVALDGFSVVVIVPLDGLPEVVGEVVDFLLQETHAASRIAKTIVFFTMVPHSLIRMLAAYTGAVLTRQQFESI
jgi:hypothetical protein